MRLVLVTLALSLATSAAAQDPGTVQLPLDRYQELTQTQSGGSSGPSHAFSNVRVSVTVREDGGVARATVNVQAKAQTFRDEGWTLVPLANAGGLHGATVDGSPAALVEHGGMVAWPTQGAGSHDLSWSFEVDASRHDGGWALAVPTPAAGGQLTATFSDMEVAPVVVPASGVSTNRAGNDTRLTATIPAGAGLQLTWRGDATGGYTLSRARYRGELVGESIRWTAELGAELEGNGRALVPLFPSSVALESVTVDRAEAPIAVHEGRFAVPIRGRGIHRIQASFLVPIQRDGGLPHVELDIASTPVSRFELSLPGEREVQVTPAAGVTATRRGGSTLAQFNVPMSSHVGIRWAEAVPDDATGDVETRANANVVHVVSPDEGVLNVRAFVGIELTRGAMRRVVLELPRDAQVNSVESTGGVVSDWRVTGSGSDRLLTVFLDREMEAAIELDVRYERSWPVATRTTEAFDVPLLRVAEDEGVTRQRGMVALLAIGELTLEPRETAHVNRVGDNSLPASVRDELAATVAHTYRYLDEAPRLSAIGATREPEPARFDAQVDTLVSLGDVSTTIATRVEVEVKSGSLSELSLRIPEGLSLLEVSAPSLRRYVLDEDTRTLRIELTQPMEGRFTVELLSDRVTGQEEELTIPLLGAQGAEVERGRVGVEALAAFQVDMAAADGLSPIDAVELPEPLLLRTDNPILHAYRYAQATEPPRLAVRITRHGEIQTANATIDEARYSTLYTRDGVAVTTARWVVRNRRQQFLRVGLPAGSEVWSARVDGRSQAPALEAGSDADEPTVLLNIVSAAEAFEVELVYATEVPELGSLGRLRAELPTLDIVATSTVWELTVPDGVTYADPGGSLTLVEGGYHSTHTGSTANGEPVAAEGIRYVFQQMYASRSDGPGTFSIAYLSGWGGVLAKAVSGFGALLLWLGLLAMAMLRFRIGLPEGLRERIPLATYRDHESGVAPVKERRRMWASVISVSVVGAVLLGVTLGYLSVPSTVAASVSGVIVLALIGLALKTYLPKVAKPAFATAGGAPMPDEGPAPMPVRVAAPETVDGEAADASEPPTEP